MTTHLLSLWHEARARFSNQLIHLYEGDLPKRLNHSPNSVGFLLRHIAEVELLFSKNVFGIKDIHITAKTVIDKKDSGEWVNLEELVKFQNYAFINLELAILKQSDEDWKQVIETKEFGSKTKSEALGRIISHTAYHAGQLAMVIKYGK